VLFGLLCLAASSRWILDEGWPATISTLQSGAWACGVLAVLVGAMAWRRSLPQPRNAASLLLVGAGLLAAPAVGAVLHGAASASLDRTVALCFVPVIVAVVLGIRSDGAGLNLWAGLAGLSGALLVFPVGTPSSARAYIGLLAPAVMVVFACVECRRAARGIAKLWSAALLFAGGAFGLVVLKVVRGGSASGVSVSAIALDALLAGLAVTVALEWDGLLYAARYFAVPLLTIVEGVVLLHPGLAWRLVAGLVLLAAATVGLLRGQRTANGTSVLRLR